MTRKDYELIADAILDARFKIYDNDQAQVGIDTVVDRLVKDLRRDNPRFDEFKFRKASST